MIITHVQRISLWFVVLLAFANAHEPKSSSSEDMFGRKCDNGKGRYEAVVRVSFNPILQNDYYKVVGSTFKYDGVIVRSSLRDSIARHEFGHKYYANHCWLDTAKVQEVMVVIDSICEPEVVCEGRNQSLKSLKKNCPGFCNKSIRQISHLICE